MSTLQGTFMTDEEQIAAEDAIAEIREIDVIAGGGMPCFECCGRRWVAHDLPDVPMTGPAVLARLAVAGLEVPRHLAERFAAAQVDAALGLGEVLDCSRCAGTGCER